MFRLLREAFHEELVAAIQPSFNEYFHNQPHFTKEDRNLLASNINRDARHIGLTLRCGRTGHPASISHGMKDTNSDIMRFRIRIYERGRPSITLTSTELPELELMPDPPRVEALSREFRESKGERSR
jgi:hypothetical protein